MKRLFCFFGFHDWYVPDYIIGAGTGTTFYIKFCGRCFKKELD